MTGTDTANIAHKLYLDGDLSFDQMSYLSSGANQLGLGKDPNGGWTYTPAGGIVTTGC